MRNDLIQKFQIEKQLDQIEWYFKPTTCPARSGHRGHLRREIVMSQSFKKKLNKLFT